MPARSYTAEQREAADQARREQVEQLHELLAEQVGSLDNRVEWEAFLPFARGFTDYSFLNRLAIMAQRPDATAVAGYRAWQAKGYQVRKGETAIRVLGPVMCRAQLLDHSGNPVLDADGRPRETRKIIGVKPVPVFDISQTDGPPAPRVPTPVLLTGQAPPGLWDSLAEVVARQGFMLERGDCGAANGFTSFAERTVRVRDDVDEAMAVRVLAHELGHVLLADPTTVEGIVDCRGVREVEAESVSFMVVGAHGLDASQYSFRYVTGWAHQSEGNLTPEQVVRATGQRVIETVDKILAHTQPKPSPAEDALDAYEHEINRTLDAPRWTPTTSAYPSGVQHERAAQTWGSDRSRQTVIQR
ncbi:ArdC family protein [Micropruina sonneratiae]|uniref:ArdC family protein n=1 Tax=Micropruina sonneratiae TaxID=2986940 RepID=UPI002227AEC4|nr:ArdC family protein [Micropruina sp. KQZ13P-5]MCW3159462.1 ArdC family protein [Micropruina sp. KQZ13P-5]